LFAIWSNPPLSGRLGGTAVLFGFLCLIASMVISINWDEFDEFNE
jgi:hypothetical protein